MIATVSRRAALQYLKESRLLLRRTASRFGDDLHVATRKTAQSMTMGKRIFRLLVDNGNMYSARRVLSDAGDQQTADLLREIMLKLMEELEPRNAGVQRAITRLNNAINGTTTPENLRNQVFKVADELGMKLPHALF